MASRHPGSDLILRLENKFKDFRSFFLSSRTQFEIQMTHFLWNNSNWKNRASLINDASPEFKDSQEKTNLTLKIFTAV